MQTLQKYSANINKIIRMFQEFSLKNVFFQHYENIHQVQNAW